MTIANLAKLKVVAGFAEADATKIKVGQHATRHALGAHEHLGRRQGDGRVADLDRHEQRRDLRRHVRLVNPPASVRNGMTADVSVTVATRTNVLSSQRRDHHDRTPSSTVRVFATASRPLPQ